MAEKKKTAAEELAEKLLSKHENGILRIDDKELEVCDDFNEGYKDFLNTAKTEREAVEEIIRLAKDAGYTEFERGKKYKAGDKFYFNNRGKAIILTVMGKKNISEGIRLAAAHLDSPRLDMKQNPLYEDKEIAYFKTHYYGGIKKYQWPTDILPHLAESQYKRPVNKLVTGEELNIIVGSRPFKDDKISNKVKLNIMAILNEKYGIIEDDLVSAELEAVPAFKAVDVGFDRSLVGAYGQDDRVCAYSSLMATLQLKKPEYTCMTVLTDKEETGSDGNTGLNSSYLPYFINDLAEAYGVNGYNVMSRSECLSADVNAAVDPTFIEPFEIRNCSQLNYGVVATKFTGARGKSGTSDASAEYVGRIRRLFDKNNVIWQTGELGKVDAGGGGTVAQFIANLDFEVIDVGVSVLSMHAPFEITSKLDNYMAYKAFKVFFEDK